MYLFGIKALSRSTVIIKSGAPHTIFVSIVPLFPVTMFICSKGFKGLRHAAKIIGIISESFFVYLFFIFLRVGKVQAPHGDPPHHCDHHVTDGQSKLPWHVVRQMNNFLSENES